MVTESICYNSEEKGNGSRVREQGLSNRLSYTPQEVAWLLGLAKSSVYLAIQSGEIRSVKVGRRILVPQAVLAKLLEAA